jgi:hypothetical protein
MLTQQVVALLLHSHTLIWRGTLGWSMLCQLTPLVTSMDWSTQDWGGLCGAAGGEHWWQCGRRVCVRLLCVLCVCRVCCVCCVPCVQHAR